MGKGKPKVITMTPWELKKMENKTFDMMFCLVLAYMMDELDYDQDKIIDLWDSVVNYSCRIKDHTITLSKVKQIIEEHTGIKFLGWK